MGISIEKKDTENFEKVCLNLNIILEVLDQCLPKILKYNSSKLDEVKYRKAYMGFAS